MGSFVFSTRSLQHFRAIQQAQPLRLRRKICINSLPLGSSDADSAWSRLSLLKRQLAIAVKEEDFKQASSLRDEIAVCEDGLSTQKRLLLGMLEGLERGETPRDRIRAAQTLGDLGDAAALPSLQAALSDELIGDVAEASMWSIFMYSSNEAVSKLMQEGLIAMSRSTTFPQALEIFGKVIQIDPSFAEGYNKRATTLYLMEQHADAIEDCKFVLELNPYHFGAAAGMGMCAAALKDYSTALEAFTTAVLINPRLDHIKHHIAQLTEIIEEQRGES